MTEQLFARTWGDAVADARRVVEFQRQIADTKDAPIKAVVGFASGGDASTVMLDVLKDRLTHIAHIQTGTAPDAVSDFVRWHANRLDLPLIERVVSPDYFKTYAEGGRKSWDGLQWKATGMPTPGTHNVLYWWVKGRALEEIRHEFIDDRTRTTERVMFVTAAPKEVTTTSSGLSSSSAQSTIWTYPMLDFDRALRDAYKRANPSCPRSPVPDACGTCLCGAFGDARALEAIETAWPEHYEYLMSIEASAAGSWGGAQQGGECVARVLCSGSNAREWTSIEPISEPIIDSEEWQSHEGQMIMFPS